MPGLNIKKAIKHPGALHRDLHVPQGKKIPRAKLEKAAHRPGVVGRRARFAETLEGFNRGAQVKKNVKRGRRRRKQS